MPRTRRRADGVCAAAAALSLVLCSPSAYGRRSTPRYQVTYVHGERCYLDAGAQQGLTVGAKVEVLHGGRRIAELKVTAVSRARSVAVFTRLRKVPRVGDTARARRAVRVPPRRAPPSPARAAAVPAAWARPAPSTFPQVAFHGASRPPVRSRAQAFLRADGFFFFDASPPLVTARQRLMLALDAPVDPRGHVRAGVLGQVVLQPLQTGRVTFERNRLAWLELYQAQLTWSPNPQLELGVGRTASAGLRHGLMDGAHVFWHADDLLTLRAAVGLRPDPVTLLPGVQRPAAVLSAHGLVDGSWGSVWYATALSWLVREQLALEGAEATTQVRAALAELLWLDADAAWVGWLTPKGRPELTVERLGMSAMSRAGPLSVALSARRYASAALPSSKHRLPDGYLSGNAIYDVSAWAEASGGGAARAGVTVSGGVLWDSGHQADRMYLAPELHLRVGSLWGLNARVGMRTEAGPLSGEFANVNLSAEPWLGARMWVWVQSGAYVAVAQRDIQPSTVWSVGADHRVLGGLVAGLRSRGSVSPLGVDAVLLGRKLAGGPRSFWIEGQAGNALELSAWVGADRF